LIFRTFSHQDQEEWAQYASIPVINALSDLFHPCQILADIFTIKEHRGHYQGAKVAYLGDGNNIAHSWLAVASKLDIRLRIASPPGYQPRPDIVTRARESAILRDDPIEIMEDPYQAVHGVDFVYTDVWTSMGQETEQAERRQVFYKYQLNRQLLSAAPAKACIMHCLPAHRGDEITNDVLEGERSLVFEEAENRLHIQKALLEWLLAEAL
jgi:ornithine carbamoyltransferase